MLVVNNWVFIDIPKCGCTSIFRALNRFPKPHWHQRDIPDSVYSLPRFAVIRNPFDRALSLFHFERYQCSIGNKQKHPGGAEAFYVEKRLHDFTAFMEGLIENRTNQDKGFPTHYPNFLPCSLFLKDVQPVERLLRLESLQKDWDETPGLPRVSIPRTRVGKYEREMTEHQAHLVRAWAIEDFGYGYSPDFH